MFRYFYSIILILSAQSSSFSQNLLTNGSFETLISCPSPPGEIGLALDWDVPGNTGWSPSSDLFNTCAAPPPPGSGLIVMATVPQNLVGDQTPRTGAGYAGVLLRTDNLNYREYIEYELPTALTAGVTYDVGFYVSPGDEMPFFTDRIGMHISSGPILGTGSWTLLTGNPMPQIENPAGAIINNVSGWTLVAGQYTANGTETHLYIGNFADDANMMIAPNPVSPGPAFASDERVYMYIDDVFIQLQGCALDIPDTAICAGESFVAIPQGIWDTYTWSTGTSMSTETFNTAGQYWVTVTNAQCTVTDTFEVDILPSPVFSLGNDTTICPGANLILSAPNIAGTISWWDGSQNQQQILTSNGTYWLELNDNGCVHRDSLDVSIHMLPDLNLGNDTTICANSTFELDATLAAANNYLWNDGSFNALLPVVQTGEYFVEVSIFECVIFDTINIDVVDAPMPVQIDTSLCGGDVITIDGGEWYMPQFNWSTGGTLQYESFSQTGNYTLEISNFCGAQTANINISEELFCDCNIYIPNAFTPQGDGINELFKIEHNCEFEEYTLQIYDRWGQLIFTSSDPMEAWDGTFLGNIAKEDIYIWKLQADVFVKGNRLYKSKKGHITLLK